MYKHYLFRNGAESFLPYKRGSPSYGRGCCGAGVNSNLDDHLLSLVRGVSRMSVKPKLRTKRISGTGLKFVR
jgi:hypothetical protein